MKRSAWALLLWMGCAAEPQISSGTFDLSQARLVDLSHSYDAETIYWPTSPTSFELSELAHGMSDGGYFYSAYSFCTPEHGGTHLDAPVHFAEDGSTAAEVPLDQLIAPGIVIDMSEAAAADPDAQLDVETIQRWEQRNGVIPRGSIVLLRTGWADRWPDTSSYLGDDTPFDASQLHFPGYGAEAARYLVEEREVFVLGVDSASIDPGPSTDFIVHRIAAASGVSNLENVADLTGLPEKGFWVLALPMKIGNGSGAPVRIVAVVPEGVAR